MEYIRTKKIMVVSDRSGGGAGLCPEYGLRLHESPCFRTAVAGPGIAAGPPGSGGGDD